MTAAEPKEVVMELSAAKAREVSAGCEVQHSGCAEQSGMPCSDTEKKRLIIAADTVVAADGMILGKPKDEADAVRMLTMLQGRTHQVYTGAAQLL